jgi:hypothetical protein
MGGRQGRPRQESAAREEGQLARSENPRRDGFAVARLWPKRRCGTSHSHAVRAPQTARYPCLQAGSVVPRRLASFRAARPVTPEVAGSSPVARVSDLQGFSVRAPRLSRTLTPLQTPQRAALASRRSRIALWDVRRARRPRSRRRRRVDNDDAAAGEGTGLPPCCAARNRHGSWCLPPSRVRRPVHDHRLRHRLAVVGRALMARISSALAIGRA